MIDAEYTNLIEEYRDRFDYILEESDGCDFHEIVGSIGGDIERVRVYQNGRVGVK